MDKESLLLLFFLSNYDRLLNVREASRKTGVSRSTASRLLRMLNSKGVLAKREAGNQIFYSLDTRNPLTLNMCALVLGLKYNELELPRSISRQTTSFVESCKNSLGEQPSSIVLFGSTARGEAGKGSDVDILVILRSLKEGGKANTIAQSINASHTNKISPTTITMKSFAAEIRAGNLLYLKIVKEGIPLFGAETYLREVFEFLEEVAR